MGMSVILEFFLFFAVYADHYYFDQLFKKNNNSETIWPVPTKTLKYMFL